MSTFFGTPSTFAFECEARAAFGIDPSIHLCIWVGGEPIGNFDIPISAVAVANALDEFLSLAPLRSQHNLAERDAYYVLYSLAAPPLFGRDEPRRRLLERGYADAYVCEDTRPFDVAKVGGDAFADVQAMLVRGNHGAERFLWSEDPIAVAASFTAHEHELPAGEITRVGLELLAWLDEELDVAPTWRDAALSAVVKKRSTPNNLAKVAKATITQRPARRTKAPKRRAG